MIDLKNPNYRALPGQKKNRIFSMKHREIRKIIDVSIVTPYFNTEDFFIETYNSVIAQSLQNWEWIIVDDGSTDQESVARLEKIYRSDERIKVVRQDNGGPSAARNHGASVAKGRYICLLDSDDLLEPTYLEKCVWFLESNKNFSFCNSYSVFFGDQEHLWTAGFDRGKQFLKANSGPPISLIRSEVYAASGGFDDSIRFGHEDWDFWLRMASFGYWGYTIPEYLQWYRKRSSGRFEQIMNADGVNDQFENLISDKYGYLSEGFPDPRPIPMQAYESLELSCLIQNDLLPNPQGRRILFLVPWMVVGGADRVNLDLIEGLQSKGHEVSVCATLSADHVWESKFADLTPDVFVLPNILRLADYPRFLTYLIHSRCIDTVVVSGSTTGYQFLPFLRSACSDTAFVDLCHVEELKWMNGGHPRFGVGYQDVLDLNIVTTKHLADWMKARGADAERIRVMYTGVLTGQMKAVGKERRSRRMRYGLDEELPVIIFAGRLCEQKRPTVLIDILRTARDSGLKFQGIIIGDGELKREVESKLEHYGLLSQVRLAGALPHDKWLDVLGVADVLLMPSAYEGISIALLEAMAAGVVPVVAKVGGQDELVGEEQGYLIAHGDDERIEYVSALARLLSGSGELEKKSAACWSAMREKHNRTQTIDELERIFDEAQVIHRNALPPISRSLATEILSLSLENLRLSKVLEPFTFNVGGGADGSPRMLSPRAALIVHGMVRISNSKVGATILNSSAFGFIGRIAIRLFKKFF